MITVLWLGVAAAACAMPVPSPARLRLRSMPRSALAGVTGPTSDLRARTDSRGGRMCRRSDRAVRVQGGWTGSARHRRAAIVSVAALLGLAAAVTSRQILVGAAVASVVGTGVFLSAHRAVRARAVTARRELRTALSMVDAELSAGAREQEALAAAALVGGGCAVIFGAAAQTSGRGGDVAAIFTGAGPGFTGLAAAWAMRSICGTPLAEIVAKVEVDLAAAEAHDRLVDAALAGPRSSAAMLSVLPVLGLVLGSAMGAHPLRLLLGTSHGSALLLAGVIIDILGLLWTRLLVRAGGGP